MQQKITRNMKSIFMFRLGDSAQCAVHSRFALGVIAAPALNTEQ